MSRANFVIILVLVAALAGMFFWTLSIYNRQAAFGGRSSGGSGPGANSEMASRVESLEEQLAVLDQGQRALRGDVGILEGRVDTLGSVTENQADRLEALGSGEALPASVALEGGGQLNSAIEKVLAEKAEKERRERLERMVRMRSRWLLSDIEATDEQQDQFVKIIKSYYEKRETLRKRLEEEEADAQRREIAYTELDQQRNQEVVRVFGAADSAKIEERLNRTGRRMGGRGSRGPSGGGFRGRSGGGR